MYKRAEERADPRCDSSEVRPKALIILPDLTWEPLILSEKNQAEGVRL